MADEFRRGPICDNHVFQFVYRSFYRLDLAGLSDEFKRTYFGLMEEWRGSAQVDLEGILRRLSRIPNRKGLQSLQFSFATKLAHTVNSDYPMVDAGVAEMFGFQRPAYSKPLKARIAESLEFYEFLRESYREILKADLLHEPIQLFRERYTPASERVPPIKVLDFIFWSAGKLLSRRPE